MSITGTWNLFYSWGCSGGYNQSTFTFNNDGTFTSGDGFNGQWAMVGGNVQLVYEPAPSAVYSGTVTGGAMVGMMTNFSIGAQGCWYATIGTIPALHAAKSKVAHADHVDSTGGKKK